MATTEERMQILKMIEEGKISAKEGAELIKALDKGGPSRPGEPIKGASAPRWFRVRITDNKSGRTKANINIPMGLVNVGIKMGARFTPDVESFDLNQLLQAIQSGQQGKVVDVMNRDDDERIEIFVE
jgi:hypothetical protein